MGGTRRILQGGEDTYPLDGGTVRGEAFHVTLASNNGGSRVTGNYVDAVWKPNAPSSSRVMIQKIVATVASGQTTGGSTSSGLNVNILLQVARSSDQYGDFNLWGIQMPAGDWVYKGSNNGYNWAAPANAGGYAVNGLGARVISGSDQGQGAGNYEKGSGLGSTSGGYYFNFPFSGYFVTVDSLQLLVEVSNPSGSSGLAIVAAFDVYGMITLS